MLSDSDLKPALLLCSSSITVIRCGNDLPSRSSFQTVGTSLACKLLKADDVLETLSTLFITEGVRDHIRSDNGSEFAAKALRDWIGCIRVKTAFIEPGRMVTTRVLTGSSKMSS